MNCNRQRPRRNTGVLRSAQNDNFREAFGSDPAGLAVVVDGVGASGLCEALVELRPVAVIVCVEGGEGKEDEGVEEVVEFVLVAEVRPDFATDGGDGFGVDAAGFVGETVLTEVMNGLRAEYKL